MDIDERLHPPPELVQGRFGRHGVGRRGCGVCEWEARAAIERGEHIAIDDTGSLRTLLVGVRFERAPLGATPSHQIVMAYRQAGMFVSYLHDSDAPGFARMMNAVLDGRPFVEAVDVGYHQDVYALWQGFAPTGAERK
jgi:hypothetical protein